jgi:hypothetical protein
MIAVMAQSPKDKQPDALPPRRNRSEAVARGIGFVGGAALARAGFQDPTLVLRWDEIAGPELARIARPLKWSEGASGGTLTLKAEPGAALFLQHETRALCERINTYLGRAAVSKLRFVQGPLPQKTIHRLAPKRAATVPSNDPALSYKGRESLKDALVNLARARVAAKQADGN